MTVERMQEILIEWFNVSEETMRIITAINGYNEDTMKDILFVVAGYRDFDQLEEE